MTVSFEYKMFDKKLKIGFEKAYGKRTRAFFLGPTFNSITIM